MSTLVDERVVEMSFDNSNFEKNVKQSINTIDDLKGSLDFSGMSKAINNDVKGITMDPLIYGLENVKQSFSAWEVVAISVISNITNRITNLGVKMVESLSVDNVSSGWAKYSENVKSVGTLLSQDGNTIDNVSTALEKLMWYTDQTSYSYTDMVSNISKFTATGQSLEDSVQAMMGIANWAAMSGQGTATASRAMYQLSQAMGQGYVKLMDYKSIQNANMDTAEFRQTVLDTAVAMGYLTQSIDGVYTTTELAQEAGKQFTKSQFATQLSTGWFTSDLLMKTLGKYSAAVDKLYEDTQSGAFDTAAQAIEAYEAQLEETGTEEEKFALKTFKAAQEARTFEDAINATKDAVSSGWLSTFDKIFGDYKESKILWTNLADELWDVFAAGGAARNDILDAWKTLGGRDDIFDSETGAFWNLFYAIKSVTETIKEAWKSIFGLGNAMNENESYTDAAGRKLKSFTETLKDLSARFKNFVDRQLEPLSTVLRGIFSILKIIGKTVKAVYDGIKPVFDGISFGASSILNKVLVPLAKKIEDFANNARFFQKISTTISDSLDKITDKILDLDVINKFKEAITLAFDTASKVVSKFMSKFKNNRATQSIQNMTNTVREFISSGQATIVLDKILDGLTAVVKAIGYVADVVVTFVKETLYPLTLKVLPYLAKFIGTLGGYIVRFAVNLAYMIRVFVNFVTTNEKIQNGIHKIIQAFKAIPGVFVAILPFIKGLGNVFLKLLDIIAELPVIVVNAVRKISNSSLGDIFKHLADTIVSAVHAIGNALASFRDVDTGGVDEFSKDVTPKLQPLQAVFSGLKSLFEGLWNVIKALMPVFGAIFTLIGEGLNWIANILKNTFTGNESPLEIVKKVFSVATWGTALAGIYYVFSSFESFVRAITGTFVGVADVLDSKAMMQYAEALKTFSIALLLVVASLILISSMDAEQLAKSLTVLTMIVTGMIAVMKVLNNTFATEFTGFKSAITGVAASFSKARTISAAGTLILMFAAAIGVLALSMKLISNMSFEQISNSLIAIAGIIAMLLVACRVLSRQKGLIIKGAGTMLMLAIAIRLLVKPIKLLGNMDKSQLKQGLIAAGLIMAMLVVVSKIFKMKNAPALSAFAADLIALSVGLSILAGTLTVMSLLNPGKAWNAVGIIAALMVIFVAVAKLTKISNTSSLATFALSMILLGVALTELTASVTILSALPVGKVWNGVGALVAFIAVMAGISHLIGIFSSLKLVIFAAGMIELGKAMAIFAAVIVLLGTMEEDALTRGRKTVELFILAMIGIVKLVGIFSSLKLSVFASGMILMGAAMLEFAMVISILGNMEAGNLWKGIGAITAFIAAIVVLSKFTSTGSSTGLVVLGAALATIAVGFIALSAALAIFGAMNILTLVKGFSVLVLTLAALVVVSKLLGPGVITLLALGTALTMIATAALLFASALTLITALGAGAGLAIAALLEGLLNSIINLGPSIAQAAETLITALLSALSNSLTQIFSMVETLLGNVINLVKDKGPALIETVMLLLTSLLDALATNAPKIAKDLVTILLAILDALKEAAGRIFQDVLDILFALIDTLTANVPILMEKLGNLVIALVDGAVATIVKLVPKLIDSGFDLILGLIEGIGQAIEKNAERVRNTIISFAQHIWNAFLSFFGIKRDGADSEKAEGAGNSIMGGLFGGLFSKVSKILNFFTGLVSKVFNAFKTGDWSKLGKYIIEGIWNGIKSIWNGFLNFWKNLWNGIVNWFKSLFGIHSPSRLFYGYGQNTVEGYQNGMDDGQNGIYNTMEDIYDNTADIWDNDAIYAKYGEQINQALANAMINQSGKIYEAVNTMLSDSLEIIKMSEPEFQEAISKILDIINNEITDEDLTIRPVMDLSNIQEGTSLIAAMLSSVSGYSISGSNKIAEQTSNDMAANGKQSVNSSTESTTNNTITSGQNGEGYNVVFNIWGADPKEVAEEVNKKLQSFVERRKEQWA